MLSTRSLLFSKTFEEVHQVFISPGRTNLKSVPFFGSELLFDCFSPSEEGALIEISGSTGFYAPVILVLLLIG